MIRSLTRLGVLACAAVLSAGAAHAATFDISYTFTSGDTVTGTVDGTLNGDYIDDLSNIKLSFDGVAVAGTLYATTWDAATSSFDLSTAARISTDASLNNFFLADSSDLSSPSVTTTFAFINDVNVQDGGALVSFTNYDTGAVAIDGPANTSWTVSAAPVPEPASVALLIAGLGVVGAAARRRRAA